MNKRDFYELKINDKTYKLVYRTKKYEVIDGIEKLIEKKLIPYVTKIKIVNAILNNKHNHKTVNENILDSLVKNSYKKTSDNLMDNNAIILDILSSYLLYDDNKDYLIDDELDRINSIECIRLGIDNNSSQHKPFQNDYPDWEIRKYTAKDYDKWKESNKRSLKKWRHTTTYKLNMLYSFQNKIDNSFDRKGIINKSLPYLTEWCYVDSDNNFEFDCKKYKIINNKNFNHSCYKILCFKQFDKYYFFNENINEIKNKYIING